MEPWAKRKSKYQNIGNKVNQPTMSRDFYYSKSAISDIPIPTFFATEIFFLPDRAIFLSSNLPCLRI